MGDVIDMSRETETEYNIADIKPSLFESRSLAPEIIEYLKPSPEVVHQTGLELINTRLFMSQIKKVIGLPLTVDKIPTEVWEERFKNNDIIWFMGIYKPSEEGRQQALQYANQYTRALPDLDPEKDIVSSPYAIPSYEPNPIIAPNWEAWDTMVDRLHKIDKKVFIDFVPNHVAIDHPWARIHPEYFIQGTQEQYIANTHKYQKTIGEDGTIYYLAHGKDPNFPEWEDTLQLNYANPFLQNEMEELLCGLVKHADGVRCDMAMLLNPSTFLRTWGDHLTHEEKKYISNNNFWEKAIPRVKQFANSQGKDDFAFVAEAYWDKEEIGKSFDYIYGKEFYDHLKKIVRSGEPVRPYLPDHIEYVMTAARKGRHYRDVLFTENHDEERAVKEFGEAASKAAAALTAFIPESIFLLNQGQNEGRRIRPPMQIGRFPEEAQDHEMMQYYDRLLTLKRSTLFQQGEWSIADLSQLHDNIVALQVESQDNNSKKIGAIICINFGHVTANGSVSEIQKGMDASVYRLNKGDFVMNPDMNRENGMYLELLPWETQIIFYKK